MIPNNVLYFAQARRWVMAGEQRLLQADHDVKAALRRQDARYAGALKDPIADVVLSVSSETLDKLAEIADKVADVALTTAVYSATSAPEPNTSTEIQELAKNIVELKLQTSRMSRPRNK
ncbi:hypothetical protein TNCV_3321511 [Trichonephila clavipes]|nr:hypothetical protein TNCV_3321511 [Trichonephila clavipes]